MKNYMNLLVILCVFLVSMTSCPDGADDNIRYSIENGSEKEIYVCVNNENYPKCPDEEIPISKTGRIIPAKKREALNYVFAECELRVYIFSMDTINKYSWEDIRQNNRYMKKYVFESEADLRKINYKIIYS